MHTMLTMHPIEGCLPMDSQRSREAAERSAVLAALREIKRNRRESSARRLTWLPTRRRSRRLTAAMP
jgi:hypothetical protein